MKKVCVQSTLWDRYKVVLSCIHPPTGWEYTVEAGLNTPYVPFERNIHLSRRRRWVRIRVRDPDSKAVEKKRVGKLCLLHQMNDAYLIAHCSKSVPRP